MTTWEELAGESEAASTALDQAAGALNRAMYELDRLNGMQNTSTWVDAKAKYDRARRDYDAAAARDTRATAALRAHSRG